MLKRVNRKNFRIYTQNGQGSLLGDEISGAFGRDRRGKHTVLKDSNRQHGTRQVCARKAGGRMEKTEVGG